MSRVRQRLKASISVKLIFVILPIMLVILYLFGRQSNDFYQEMITQEISEQLQMRVDSAASQISSDLREISRTTFYAYSDLELREALAEAVLEPEKFTAADRLALHTDVIEPMFQIINSPSRYTLTLYPLSERLFCDYRLVCPIEAFPEELPLKEMLESGYAYTFYHVARLDASYSEERQSALCITRVIYHSDRTPLGVLSTQVLTRSLESAMTAILPEDDDFWYRCELPDGSVVFEAGAQTEDMLIMSSVIGSADAKLYFGVNAGLIDQQILHQNLMLSAFAVVVMVIAAALITLLSSLVMRRLRRVLGKFSRLRPGEELTEPALEGYDEAALLDQTFSQLYREYYDSTRTQQKLKENQRLLETNLLLSRINPHFLYNTLSAIRWKLPVEYWEIVDKLVAFYRNILAKGREIAFLSGELELMHQYIDLQRFTYSREISYTEEIEPGLDMLLMPKFLLQPVFENAIQYSGKGETIYVHLQAHREGDRLILTLDNSGEPIDGEIARKLNELNDLTEEPLLRYSFDPNDSHGYGIFNIIMRLRLIFGRGYGLWHERTEKGTRARFVLPVCEKPDEIQNWKKTH